MNGPAKTSWSVYIYIICFRQALLCNMYAKLVQIFY